MAQLTDFLSGVAGAIRDKKQTSAPIPAAKFAAEILGIQGGDPEGRGFFRSMSGSKSGVSANMSTTVNCGFVAEAILCIGTNGGGRVVFLWCGNQRLTAYIANMGQITGAYYNPDNQAAVNGNTVTFNPSNWGSTTGDTISFAYTYTIFGRVQA